MRAYEADRPIIEPERGYMQPDYPSYEDCMNTAVQSVTVAMNTLGYKINDLKEINNYLRSDKIEEIISGLYYVLGITNNFITHIQGIHNGQRCPYTVRDLKKFLEGLEDDQEVDINFLKALKS